MIERRSKSELELMRESGRLLAEVMAIVRAAVRPGVRLRELNTLAKQEIEKRHAVPSFEGYRQRESDTPFPAVLCASVNSEVVHGLGIRERALKTGDIIGLDLGLQHKGWHTDMAVTVPVGAVPKEVMTLISVTEEALRAGIGKLRPGVSLFSVSTAIYEVITKAGFGVVTSFCGHGVGKKVHEEPMVPNYPTEQAKRILLEEGMTLAIEPMVTMGNPALIIADDGWTARTDDGSLGAHFEHTIAITMDGAEILTK